MGGINHQKWVVPMTLLYPQKKRFCDSHFLALAEWSIFHWLFSTWFGKNRFPRTYVTGHTCLKMRIWWYTYHIYRFYDTWYYIYSYIDITFSPLSTECLLEENHEKPSVLSNSHLHLNHLGWAMMGSPTRRPNQWGQPQGATQCMDTPRAMWKTI